MCVHLLFGLMLLDSKFFSYVAYANHIKNQALSPSVVSNIQFLAHLWCAYAIPLCLSWIVCRVVGGVCVEHILPQGVDGLNSNLLHLFIII